MKLAHKNQLKLLGIVGIILFANSLTGCTFAKEVKKNDITGKLLYNALPADTAVDKRDNYFGLK